MGELKGDGHNALTDMLTLHQERGYIDCMEDANRLMTERGYEYGFSHASAVQFLRDLLGQFKLRQAAAAQPAAQRKED